MNPQIALLFETVLYALIILIIGRSLISWFPISPRNEFVRFLDRVTEPILAPFRGVIPRIGMIDLSGMAVIILLYLMIGVVKTVAHR